MVKKLLVSLVGLLIASILRFDIVFFIEFGAADYQWPYSYLHFTVYLRMLLVILIAMVSTIILIMLLDKKRKGFSMLKISVVSSTVFLILLLSELFFSIHALMRAGVLVYTPVINSTLVMFLAGRIAIISVVIEILLVWKSSKLAAV